MRISEYNTVINGKDEIDFSKFIKLFKEESFDKRWIEYDQTKKQFTVYFDDNEYNLLLPKNVDKNVLEVLNQLDARYKLYRARLKVKQQVMDTGAFPTSKTDIAYYEESLKKDLYDAKIELASSGFLSVLPLMFAGLAVASFVDLFSSHDLHFLSLFGGPFSMAGLFLMVFSGPYDFKKNLEKYKLLKNKLEAFKEHVKSLKKEEDSYEEFVKEVDEQDNNKVITIRDRFLREASQIALLINGLPKEKQVHYKKKFIKVLTEYQNRVNALLEKNKNEIVLNESADVWQITVELIPQLHAIETAVREELDTLEEKDIFNSEVESVRELLQGGYTSSSYKKVA